jgi:hypothetical protein
VQHRRRCCHHLLQRRPRHLQTVLWEHLRHPHGQLLLLLLLLQQMKKMRQQY